MIALHCPVTNWLKLYGHLSCQTQTRIFVVIMARARSATGAWGISHNTISGTSFSMCRALNGWRPMRFSSQPWTVTLRKTLFNPRLKPLDLLSKGTRGDVSNCSHWLMVTAAVLANGLVVKNAKGNAFLISLGHTVRQSVAVQNSVCKSWFSLSVKVKQCNR